MSATTNRATRMPRFALGRIVATGLLALAASVAVPVWAQGTPGGPGMCGPGMGAQGVCGPGMGGPGMGGHHMGGPGMGGHGMMMLGDPARIGRMTDFMLDGLNATDAQRTQIKQIAQTAATDVKAQQEAGRALRAKGLQILAAPTVDAAAAEALRQQMLAQHDQVSKRMLQAMLDVSKVLTPEQRAKLGERITQRGDIMRERMQRWQRSPQQKG